MAADAAIVIASLCMASPLHRAGRNGKLATEKRPPRFPRAIRGRRRNLCRNGLWRNLQRDDITASCGEVNDLRIDDYSAEVRPKQKAA
jgi:hypothetical protein